MIQNFARQAIFVEWTTELVVLVDNYPAKTMLQTGCVGHTLQKTTLLLNTYGISAFECLTPIWFLDSKSWILTRICTSCASCSETIYNYVYRTGFPSFPLRNSLVEFFCVKRSVCDTHKVYFSTTYFWGLYLSIFQLLLTHITVVTPNKWRQK